MQPIGVDEQFKIPNIANLFYYFNHYYHNYLNHLYNFSKDMTEIALIKSNIFYINPWKFVSKKKIYFEIGI